MSEDRNYSMKSHVSTPAGPASPQAAPPLTLQPRDLQPLNTLGLPAWTQAYARIGHPAQLPQLSELAARHGPPLVLGGGSNIVLPPSVPGWVVQVGLAGVRLVEARSDAWIVEAGAGESWHGFVQACVRQGWDGLENLALIPGTVGAAPVQNVGAYGVELAERFLGLSAWDVAHRRMVEMSSADCRFGYRDSMFKHEPAGRWVIASVRFALPRPWRPVLEYPDLQGHPRLAQAAAPSAQDIFEAVCEIRRGKLPDPAVLGNAGSFFKNPVVAAGAYRELAARFPGLVGYPQADGRYKLAAGWLIDRCGWKGRRMGPAGVHERQALVLVNHGGARAAEILALAAAIRDDVRQRYGVELEPEPRVVADVG